MADQAPAVSIVIPARDEALRLPPSVRAIRTTFPHEPWEFLVVVEPGSDNTAAAACEATRGDERFRVIENAVARGKGHAVRTGMLAARGTIVFFMDADLSVPLEYVRHFLEAADTDAAAVFIGSRRHPETVIPVRQPFLREASGRIFNKALRWFGVTRFADTQCGFKAFRQPAAREIFERVEQDGFGFDVEAILWAEVLGYRVRELPVTWSDAKGSKVRPWHGVQALAEAILAARRIRSEDPRHAQSRSQY